MQKLDNYFKNKSNYVIRTNMQTIVDKWLYKDIFGMWIMKIIYLYSIILNQIFCIENCLKKKKKLLSY